ncbi:hypothetical protein [Conexibacter sp. SYSU D00693]|uniref:hypothetical protein n=1 Tax=Conexibacter sp. SYSU D00693 TaxID=2812560 RepID=UPI00196B13FD|nr:hypothetical protein [Conexibacter sp. SYSU D00693]
MHRPPCLARCAAVSALALAAAVPASASAQGDSAPSAPTIDVGGGETRLHLRESFVGRLADSGIRVSLSGGARGVTLQRFPATGGELNTFTAQGSVTHRGTLTLRRGSRVVRLTAPRVTFGPTSSLSFRVRGERVTVLNLSTRTTSAIVVGATLVVPDAAVVFTSGGASVLNRALGTRTFRRSLRLGDASVRATPRDTVQLRGTTQLALEPAFAQAVTAAGASFGEVPPATVPAAGTLAFPIGRRSIVAPALQTGTVDHGGGVKFVRGASSISLTDPLVRFDATPTLAVRLNYQGDRVAIGDLTLGDARPVTSGGSFTVAGIRVALNANAARALNATLGTAFQPGTALGTLTIQGQTIQP